MAVRAIVHPDGNDARLTLHTNSGSIDLVVSHEFISAIHAEIHNAATRMLYRQAMRADEGVAAFDDVLRAALRPADCHVIIERDTADRVFVLQFRDRMPLAIRMAPEQVADSLDQLTSLSRLTAN
ncbi:hypothetical protein [Mesorhizobium sp.]|uniref:hypothetical protein n=1 Tax=Mesorhizobium sp. TaxID=1871066 RepID=UPI000FE2B7F1|nr:hypothetical protein [Mesorhizobium sp.]RWQ12377.1 MAG: hypothetical protein EOR91_01290 [Mesorhizobium sp.]